MSIIRVTRDRKMAESEMQETVDLLASAGFDGTPPSDLAIADRIAAGFIWCVGALEVLDPKLDFVSRAAPSIEHKIEVGNYVEEALQVMGCPHPFHASQILNCEGVFPVVQWLVSRLKNLQDDYKDKHKSEKMQSFHVMLTTNLEELAIQEEETEFQNQCSTMHAKIQGYVAKLEEAVQSSGETNIHHDFDHFLDDAIERQNLARRELATKLREILLLKRQLDDVPSESELIQYQSRFSELDAYIQAKLQKTRRCYATYNALLEIKELMLKEISLINSLSLQFQDAIASVAGRMKLVDSMKGVLKGIKQKLDKVQVTLEAEQKVRDTAKEKYDAAMLEQRHFYSLRKALQEERAKNEKLKCRLQE